MRTMCEDNVAGKLTSAVKSGISTIKSEAGRLMKNNKGRVQIGGSKGGTDELER